MRPIAAIVLALTVVACAVAPVAARELLDRVIAVVSGTVIERCPSRSSVSRAPTTVSPITSLVPAA